MSILQLTHSRPLDPLLLEDGLLSGRSSIPSVGLGQSPESAMVEEIFNNPDVWSVQIDGEDNVDSVGGLNSGSSMSSVIDGGSTRDKRRKSTSRGRDQTSGASTKTRRSKSARLPEGYHLKRRSKLQLEAFTLKPFESRHRIMPYLSSASSMSDSSSIASSTPSLNSSLPTISDEDSVRSQLLKSVPPVPVKWRGMQDIDEGPNSSLSLVALMEPSNNMSPEAGQRMSILWSHQNIFRAFPTPKGADYDFGEGSPGSQPSAESVGSTMEAVTSAFHLTEELRDSSQTGVMKPRRNVPPLTISTTTRTATTTTTTVIAIQSPARSSPASITVVSASATWSILELYGDSPKPSPKLPKLPKTSGHLDRSFKPSDLQFPSRLRLPPKSAFATNFPPQAPHAESTASGIVELPADFVIPDLPRLRPKLKEPRIVPPSEMRVTMGNDLEPSLPLEKDATVLKNCKNGKIRPLPQPPRDHSAPPPVPILPLKVSTSPPQNKSSLPLSHVDKPHSPVSQSEAISRSKKSALRPRMPPPPPLPLDSPLPPLPSDAVNQTKGSIEKRAAAKVGQPSGATNLQKANILGEQDIKVKETEKVSVNLVKSEEKIHLSRHDAQSSQSLGVPQLLLHVSDSIADNMPARPSRKDVISPLPSPLIERLHALESLPGKPNLSPPVSAHRPSASEPFLKSTVHDLLLPEPPAQILVKRGLRKSSSISSMPRPTPDVPLPDASILAQRVRKGSAQVRPLFEPDVVNIIPGVQAKIKEVPILTLNPSGYRVASSTLPQSLSSATPPALALQGPATGKTEPTQASFNGLSVRPQTLADNVEFPSLDRNASPFTKTSSESSASKGVSFPRGSPLAMHRKGASLSSAVANPALKVHKKSSSAVSFNIPVIEHPFPNAATLAKRLATKKDSDLGGHKQAVNRGVPHKPSVPEANHAHLFPSTSDSVTARQHQNESPDSTSTVLKLPLPPTQEVWNQATAVRPSHKKNASTSALHQKPVAGDRSMKKVLSHSSLRSPGTLSPAPNLANRYRTGLISVPRPMIHRDDVPLPDASVLAQRKKAPSSLSSRLYGDTSDAFTPSTMSTDVSSLTFPQMQSDQGKREARIPLAAPEPVITAATWVPQVTTPSADTSSPTQAQIVTQLPQATVLRLERPSHSRPRSASGTRILKVSSPPMATLPFNAERGSPALLVPKAELVSRTPSPGPSILIRNRAASPAPSSLHVRFRSNENHPEPVPIATAPLAKAKPTTQNPMLEPVANNQDCQISTTTVVSPRGRSPSVLSPTRQNNSSRRSASAVAFSRNHPLPPLPIPSAEGYSSDSPNSAGSRGRVSPFPTRPISRLSTFSASLSQISTF